MNAALIAVAAQAQEAQDALFKTFTDAGATHPSRAIPFEPANDEQRHLIDGWLGEGVLKRDGKGHYYADLETQAANNASAGYTLLVLMVILISIGISVLALIKFT